MKLISMKNLDSGELKVKVGDTLDEGDLKALGLTAEEIVSKGWAYEPAPESRPAKAVQKKVEEPAPAKEEAKAITKPQEKKKKGR